MENFLLIGGSKASGKSLIRGMLDGHPELFVSPFHEIIFQALYENDNELHKKKDIQKIRELLASKGHYYSLERLTKKNYYLTVSGSDHRPINFKNFNFYSFDKSWVDELYKKNSEWNSKEICLSIYRSFNKHLKSPFLKKSSKKKYYCSMSNGYPKAISGFLKTFPKSKIIYIKRNPIEIVDGLVKRANPDLKKIPNDTRAKWFTRDALFKKWGTEEFIETIVKLDKEADEASKKYPNQVYLINFSDFFENRQRHTKNIIKFLNITNHKNLQNYSIGGFKLLSKDKTSILSKAIDINFSSLKKNQILKIKKILKKFK